MDPFFFLGQKKAYQCIFKILFPLTFPNSYIHISFMESYYYNGETPQGLLCVITASGQYCRTSSHTRKTN